MRKLSVEPLPHKLADKGIATVDSDVADDLDLEDGDFIEISSDDGYAVVRYGGTGAAGTVGIDGLTRHEINASIDDEVSVGLADVKMAENIVVEQEDSVEFYGTVSDIITEELAGRVMWPGRRSSIPLPLNGNLNVPLHVSEMEPAQPAIVTETTSVKVTQTDESETTPITYDDIGGLESELGQIQEMVELPTKHPEIFERVDVDAPNGIIMHGPPGTGKTLMAKAVANENEAYFESISGPEIMSKYYGDSEARLREVFERAEKNEPAIVFIDELDSIAPKRDESGGTERRVVAQLLALMDGLDTRGRVTVIAATNRIDSIDPALRRPGRFDREVEIGVPDRDARRHILNVHTRNMPVSDGVDMDELADNTHGFVGADLENLAREAAMYAIRRERPDLDLEEDEIPASALEDIVVEEGDFTTAFRSIEPSAMREVFVEVPDVSWGQVGGLEETKGRLQEAVEWPLSHGDLLDQFAADPPSGVLLYGPPGTGKTLMAKAVANESDANFISVKGPELLNKYVGESEKGVREIFKKARENAPTVVFFDELDAIATQRGSDNGSNNVTERVVSQLLTELDGLESLEGVTVIATSNRPDLIDSALLRAGRLDRQVHVPVPDEEARREIIDIHLEPVPLADDVDASKLVARTEGYTGADLEALRQEASMAAVREHISGDAGSDTVEWRHFEDALDEVNATVSEKAREQYEKLRKKLNQEDTGSEEKDDQFGRTFA